MPTWSDSKKAAQDRGALAVELYAAISTKASAEVDIPSVMPDHLAYQLRLSSEGKLAFSGPLSDLSGEDTPGHGLIVYRATSMEEARNLADNDPMHSHGVRTYTLRKWLVSEGNFSVEKDNTTRDIELI